jgi:hypothetical protein
MKGYLKTIASDKILRFGTLLSLLLIILSLLYSGIMYNSLPPVLPLYNQMPWGEDRLGMKLELFILPGFAFVILLTNTLLAYAIYERMPLVSRALAITCFLVSLIISIFIFRTIQLVI